MAHGETWAWWWPPSWSRAFWGRRDRQKAEVSLAFKSGFDAAEQNRRTDGWWTPSVGPNAELEGTLAIMRERSQNLVLNNPHGSKAHEVFIGVICDTGLKPRSLTGDQGLDDEVEQMFARWSEYAGAEAGANFYSLQSEATGGWFTRGGSVALRRTRPPSWDLEVPLQIQLLEDDYLDESRTEQLKGGRRIIQGVEMDVRGRILRYWLFKNHPHELQLLMGLFQSESIPVRADGVAYLFHPLRVGQQRGVPWLHPVIRHARDFDDYRDAERVRKKVEACLAGIVEGGEPSEDPKDPAIGTPAGIAPRVRDASGQVVERFSPGLIAYAPDGRVIKIHAPASIGGFGEYSDVELHSWAAGARMPYEELTGDFSKTNFHGFKAGRIPLNRTVRRLQGHALVPRFCDPIYGWFIATAVAAGRLPLRPEGYARVWIPRPPEEIDRAKDAQADKGEIDNGTLSRWEAIVRKGKDPLKYLDEMARMKAEAEARGITFASGPDAAAASPAPETPAEEEPEEAPLPEDEEDEEETNGGAGDEEDEDS